MSRPPCKTCILYATCRTKFITYISHTYNNEFHNHNLITVKCISLTKIIVTCSILKKFVIERSYSSNDITRFELYKLIQENYIVFEDIFGDSIDEFTL